MATIKFNLSTKIDKVTGKSSLLLRFVGGRLIDTRVTSGLAVNPKRWDTEKMKVIIPRMATDEQKELTKLQKKIDDLQNHILDEFVSVDKSIVNKEWLEMLIDKFYHPQKYQVKEEKTPETLLEYVKRFIEIAPQRKDKKTGRPLNFNNLQQYKATEKHLVNFAKLEKRQDYEFSEINTEFYNRFVSYLQKPIEAKDAKGKPLLNEDDTVKLIKEKFTQNTVGKHIRVLKLMLNESKSNELDISNYYVFNEEIDSIYLDEAELTQLKDYDFSEIPYLDRVRDWFLLLAWTGSRFSDLQKIMITDINGELITFRQQKTNTKVSIPLHPVVKEIFEKYDYDLPEPISNQRFNEYIKEACKMAKIDKPETFTRTEGGVLVTKSFPKHVMVSSHTGRRSFCTNMYKRGLPTLMIMSVSGHKTENSFLKYIKVKQEEHAEMMAKKWREIYK